MKIDNIDIESTINEARRLLKEDSNVSPALAAIINVLFVIVTLMANRYGLNSNNSSKPPSTDNKKIPSTRKKSKK